MSDGDNALSASFNDDIRQMEGEFLNEVLDIIDDVDEEPGLDVRGVTPNRANLSQDTRVQIQTYPSTDRQIHPSCRICFLSVSLVITLFVDFVYCGYLRAASDPVTMKLAKHPHWNLETLFLICQSSMSFGIATFITINILANVRIEYAIFHFCLSAMAMIGITDVIWVVSEQRDRKHFTTTETGDKYSARALAVHKDVWWLLELKIFEILLITITTLSWLSEWKFVTNIDIILSRRTPLQDSPLQSTRTRFNSGRTNQSITIPRVASNSELEKNSESQFPTGMGDRHDMKNSTQFSVMDETDRSKIAKNEFHEMGDGNDNTAIPRILT